MLGTPALLLAHARLVKSTPAATDRLVAVPTAVTLWFSERPETRFTKIELLDSAGTPVAVGAVARLADDAMAMTVPVTGSMANGLYTVSWRTAAADGHPLTGKFTFTLDVPAPVAVTDTAKPVQAPTRIPNTALEVPEERTVFSTSARWAELVALITIIGAVVFRLFVLPGASLPTDQATEASDRARRLADAMLVLFLITTAWRVSAQAELIQGASGWWDAVRTVAFGTRWGRGWLVGACGAVIVAVGLMIAKRAAAGWIVAALALVAVALGEALSGHPAALPQNSGLAVGVDIAHVLGAGGWLGGLTAVLLCGLPSTSRLADPERNEAGRRMVRAYHTIAMQSVALVVITGVIAAFLRLASPSDLWMVPYGNVLFRKLVFVLGLVGFGWYHWRKVVIPAWDDDTGFRFKRSAAAELLVGVIVLALTAILVATALPDK